MGGSHLKTWGSPQVFQRGFYEYGTSPFQLKPFKGFFFPGASRFLSRMSRNLLFIVPPGLFYYALANWADKKFEYYHRKEYLNSPEGQAAAGH